MKEYSKKTKGKGRIALPKYSWGGSTPGWEENTAKVARLGEINKLLAEKEREQQRTNKKST